MILGKIIRISVKLENGYKMEQGITCIFGVNLRIFLRKKYFDGMIYVSTTNVQGFIYYFGIFYLKIGKFYTFSQLGKGPIMGPKISQGKSLVSVFIFAAQIVPITIPLLSKSEISSF